MIYKSPRSVFPSPDTEAEHVAEAVYYAEPDTRGGSSVVIPKTAPIIQAALDAAFTRGYERAREDAAAVADDALPIGADDCVTCERSRVIAARIRSLVPKVEDLTSQRPGLPRR